MRQMNLEATTQSEVNHKEKINIVYQHIYIQGIQKDGIDEPTSRAAMEMQTQRYRDADTVQKGQGGMN